MNNPFDFGRQWLEAWEKQMGDALEKMTKDEKFMKSMSQVFFQSLDMKSQLEQQLEKYLKNINMPTRDDLQRMLVYLQRIEAKLLDLEDRLETASARQESGPLPDGDICTCSCGDGEDLRQPAGFTQGRKLKNQGPKGTADSKTRNKPPTAPKAPAKAFGKASAKAAAKVATTAAPKAAPGKAGKRR